MDTNLTRTLGNFAGSNGSSDAVLLDDLPCDFDDFSDDNNDDSVCTVADSSGNVRTSLTDRDDPPHVIVHNNNIMINEEMDTSDVDGHVNPIVRDDKAAPKESSFFSKLCEGMNIIHM